MAVLNELKEKQKAKWPPPYHTRNMLHKSKDPNKVFEMRKPTFWESAKYYTGEALIGLIRGIIWPFRKIGKALHNFFYMKTNFHDNGIMGPGYASWHEEHFSWGKLSFVLVIAFIIVYFIFLR